jgi:hypothetical protein
MCDHLGAGTSGMGTARLWGLECVEWVLPGFGGWNEWNGYCQALGAGMSGMGTARLVEGYYPSILSAEL